MDTPTIPGTSGLGERMARASRHTTRLAIGLVAVVSLIAGTTSVGAAKQDDRRPAPPPSVSSCDPLDPSLCLLPFPNDYFTVADPTTPTGRPRELQPGADAAQQQRNPNRPD